MGRTGLILIAVLASAAAEDWLVNTGRVVGAVTGAHERTTHEYITGRAVAYTRMTANEALAFGTAVVINDESNTALNKEKAYMTDAWHQSYQVGVKFNDMPVEEGSARARTCSEVASLAEFAWNFAVERGGSTLGQSHHGCRQHWHSMCPVSTVRGSNILFTNANVRDIVLSQITQWWQRAIGDHLASLKAERLGNQADAHQKRTCANFHIGRILHVVQDSYAIGHVVRTDKRNGQVNCGNIIMFQGYGAQDHGQHGTGDTSDNYPVTYQCAKTRSVEVVKQWLRCNAYNRLLLSNNVDAIDSFQSQYGLPCQLQSPLADAKITATGDLFARIFRLEHSGQAIIRRGSNEKAFNAASMLAGGSLYSFRSREEGGTRLSYIVQYPDSAGTIRTKEILPSGEDGVRYSSWMDVCGERHISYNERRARMLRVFGQRGYRTLEAAGEALDELLD